MSRSVTVIDDRADVTVDIGVEVSAALTVIDASRDDVEHVWDHTGRDEEVSFRIIVDPPWVANP